MLELAQESGTFIFRLGNEMVGDTCSETGRWSQPVSEVGELLKGLALGRGTHGWSLYSTGLQGQEREEYPG